jgi:hypothetical protein
MNRWNKLPSEGYKEEQKYITSKDHHFISQLSEQVKLWENIDIPTGAHEANQKLKILIRKGIPDNCRGVLWTTVTGSLFFTNESPNFYTETQFSVFGERVPKQILNSKKKIMIVFLPFSSDFWREIEFGGTLFDGRRSECCEESVMYARNGTSRNRLFTPLARFR